MSISELIKELEKLKEKHGDIEVKTQTLTHMWAPELTVKKSGNAEYVLLNS